MKRHSMKRHSMKRDRPPRRGNILVLSVLLMIVVFAVLAFAVDLGYVYTARTQLQRTADAAAMAGAWELYDEAVLRNGKSMSSAVDRARQTAVAYAGENPVTNESPSLHGGDIEVGFNPDPTNRSVSIDTLEVENANYVHVRVRRDRTQNGELPLFFARILGFDRLAAEANASAALLNGFQGFRPPSDGSRLPILPIAVDLPSWKNVQEGIGPDNYAWDDSTQSVFNGSDGIPELNIYPIGDGAPGNRGAVDIGPAGNSTSHLSDQIRNGVKPEDLIRYHDGALTFDQHGELILTGDTGISNGIKDDLAAIIGDPKMLPVFTQVSGNGNNATYTITNFVGVRVVSVMMTGKNKHVIVQPAAVVTRGGIPDPGASWRGGFTDGIFSPVWLVR